MSIVGRPQTSAVVPLFVPSVVPAGCKPWKPEGGLGAGTTPPVWWMLLLLLLLLLLVLVLLLLLLLLLSWIVALLRSTCFSC